MELRNNTLVLSAENINLIMWFLNVKGDFEVLRKIAIINILNYGLERAFDLGKNLIFHNLRKRNSILC